MHKMAIHHTIKWKKLIKLCNITIQKEMMKYVMKELVDIKNRKSLKII